MHPNSSIMEKPQQTLVCKLTTPELQKRRATVIRDLISLLRDKKGISNGYRYSFNSDDKTLDKLLHFIKTERMCCDFFQFTIAIDGPEATLEISGPEGAREFLDHEVGL